MISRFGLLRKKENLSGEEFNAHWKASHGPLAATLPGLRRYYQHAVVNKEHFGIDHKRGPWDLDGFSELHFDGLGAMMSAVDNPQFAPALADEADFLEDVHLVACEKHVVVPLQTHGQPLIKRMTLLKRLPGGAPEEFRHEWLVHHANFVKQWPNVMGYVQNIVVGRYHGSRTEVASYDEVPFDGIVEFWFRSREEAAELYASDIVLRTQDHAKVFLEEITPFFVETRQIL